MSNSDDEFKTGSAPADVAMEKQQKDYKLLDHHYKINDKNKKKHRVTPSIKKEKMNTIRLLGEPLVAHGPYTFYGALAYRKRGDVTRRKCCCNDLCSCDDNSSSSSCSSSPTARSGWSVIRMNHFYAVRPWYSKKNSSTDERQQLQQRQRNQKHSSKLASSKTAEQHHYQQSVCIGELELLWRDDSVVTANKITTSSSGKKCAGITTSNGSSINAMKNRNNNRHVGVTASSDDDDGVGNNNSAVPRRRMLPRRTRQPSAKKLEATESYTVPTSDQNPLQHSSNHRGQLSAHSTSVVKPALSTSVDHYTHGNLLCSVRLYVMPDQTATGRLSGVHGEDEVLEINPWGTGGGVDRWPGNMFVNGGNGVGAIYNGGGVDDYGYGSGSHSSGTLPSGCSGLVLRAEDFVEWVRGGLMNDDDDNDAQSDDDESLESESDSTNIKDRKPNIKILEQEEQKSGDTYENTIKEKYFTKSVIDEAVEAEDVPLAAAKIHKNYARHTKHCYRHIDRQHRPDCILKTIGRENDIKPTINKVDEKSGANDGKCYCYCCKRRRRNYQCNNKETKLNSGKQRLVVMSYSRYCRYRAQLQRKCEEQLTEKDKVSMNKDTKRIASSTSRGVDTLSTTRVLFCRDTYDYPAELLLEPFNAQQNHKPNTNVLVNHMAPKLKGWPSYPASWMSFRWNRVRRRLRHLERLSGSHEDRLKRLRRKKLKKKCHGRQNGAGGATAVTNMNYSSSTDDEDSDDSDSDEVSSATNEAATNTTTTASTSDSDGAPPTKRRNIYTTAARPQVDRPHVGIYPVSQKHVKPKQPQQQPQQQTNHRPRQLAMINQIISQTQRQQHMLVFETEEHRQEREQEERQRRWLVDALRMGGLEVTLVPLNSSGSANNKKKD